MDTNQDKAEDENTTVVVGEFQHQNCQSTLKSMIINKYQIKTNEMINETVLHAVLRQLSKNKEEWLLEFASEIIQYGQTESTLKGAKRGGGGKHALMQKNYMGYTAMSLPAFWSNHTTQKHTDLLAQMIDIGGMDLILSKNYFGETALFTSFAMERSSSQSRMMLIHAGGQELVKVKRNDGRTILHQSIAYGSLKEISCLLEIGGRDLVMETDCYGKTALHYMFDSAYDCRALPVVDKVLEKINFDKKLMMDLENHNFDSDLDEDDFYVKVLQQHKTGVDTSSTSILAPTTTRKTAPPHRMVTLSERDVQGVNEALPIRFTLRYIKLLQLITKLIDIGGRELLSKKDSVRSETAISYMFSNIHFCPNWAKQKILMELFVEIIESQSLGEFGIGILFLDENITEQDHWTHIVIPTLVALMKEYPQVPILQSAILYEAAPMFIQDIASNIDCLHIVDSKGRYPIEVGIQKNLGWYDGLRGIFEEYAAEHEHENDILALALKYGLQWDNGMGDLTQEFAYAVKRQNQQNGLYPFMVMAEGRNYDLTSIYHLMKMFPEIL